MAIPLTKSGRQNPTPCLPMPAWTSLVDGWVLFFCGNTVRRPEHPLGKLLGDLLVRLPSASGNTADPARRIPFSSGKVFSGMSHVHIANHPDIYEILRHFLGELLFSSMPRCRIYPGMPLRW